MFPRTSVRQQTTTMQRQLLSQLPKKLRGLAGFGLNAFTGLPFVSCNANARIAGGGTGRHAAEMRMWRLLKHEHLTTLLMHWIQQRLPLQGASVLNIDFSNFGGVAVLLAAVQTGHGRALPWALDTLASNTQGLKRNHPGYQDHKAAYQAWKRTTGGDQYDLVLRLVAHIDQVATSPPRLVFDRGFGNRRLLSCLLARSGHSYIRLRDGLLVRRNGTGSAVSVGSLPVGDYRVTWHGLRFRLVVATVGKTKPNLSPWAIATNDRTQTPAQIAKRYYHRFEVEETFRDWKSGLGLRHARLHRWQSLRVILGFASVATLSAWQALQQTLPVPAALVNPKKRLSFFRSWQESLARSYWTNQAAALPGG